MKLTLVLLTACLQVAANTFSQGKITLKMETSDIRKVLFAIEKKSSYRFLFDEAMIKGKPPVSINVENADINEALGQALHNTGIAYKVLNTNLVVLKEAATAADIQEVRVTGRVTDAAGTPLPGVTIAIKGSNMGTTTGDDGSYAITVPDGAVLVFSYVGFATQEETVGGRTSINVTLQPSATSLDEAVVVGYGTLRRSQVVGSVAKVDGKELAKQPVLTASQALQGKASGIQIIAPGDPGSQPQVRIRGTNTVSGDANPVYVVDGVITDNITSINTMDIASVEVLKDAASQAIYGSRAANGVILITTKKGTTGRLRVDLNAYTGIRSMTSKVKMADARTYAQYTNEARGYDNQEPMFPDLDALEYNTDWFDEVTRAGLLQNYNVSMSGGSEKTTYYFSAGYFSDDGIVRNENYERANFRLNNAYKIAPFLEFGHNLNMSVTRSKNKPSPFNDAYRNAPTTPVRFPNGDYGLLEGLSVANPVKANEQQDHTNKRIRLQGDVYALLKPVKHLSIRSSFSFNRSNYDNLNYNYAYDPISIGTDNISSLEVEDGKSFYYNFDNNATYHRTLAGRHEIIATLGYSAERNTSSRLIVRGNNVPPQSNLWYMEYADPTSVQLVENDGTLVQRASLYSRLTYTFDNKYNLSGVLRRDGSSNFPVNNKWGTFYSIGGSWVVSRERFMQNQKLFDELRIRAGYGKLGNDRVPSPVASLSPVSQLDNYWFGGNGYPIVPGISIVELRDATVSWEETKGIDAGLEFTMLRQRLSGEVTYYNKLSNVYIPVTLVALAGDKSNDVFSRAADVRNKGVEISLNWSDQASENFSYHAGFNVTFNRNNVEKVQGSLQLKGGSLGNGEVVTNTVEGEEVGSFWVYEVTGIFKTQEEVDATKAKITGSKPGDFQYRDVNNDGVLNDLDRMFVGSYQPRTYFGLNAGFNWKQLDFSVDCYGNTGNKIYNGKKAIRIGNDNIEAARAENRWTPDNINGTQPRASNTIPKPSTYYVESGDFFRINNVTLGYSLPAQQWNIGISALRVYASAQNPFIAKKYSGFTPELPGLNNSNNSLSAGIETGIYPVSTTYMFGVNVSF
ncbi:TonB-dependent receptor [Chitinophaga japonensis]|uniref:TonB-linked SusC/RagA family outer membrane protein n=1 Tax=Chitinophaga japonensis TaxID=104662 RepID=A0A562TFK2_CHIJA|nr:TonB-dependent receptor [Chitinophaga japonensis]TWI92319.1 TonB-linked SusC/RagA family outer membrane protein [Chitinophaga japonensis]